MKEIFSRRSIRKFTEEPVSEEQIEKLLRAAMQAPSACNEQPWEFVVIKDREVMKEIRAYQHFSMPLDTADCAIVICGDTKRQQYKGFWVQDCAAATQNLLLEAEYLGLGAVWMGLHPVERWVEKRRKFWAFRSRWCRWAWWQWGIRLRRRSLRTGFGRRESIGTVGKQFNCKKDEICKKPHREANFSAGLSIFSVSFAG